MLAVGVDMIDVDRIARAMQRHGERFDRRFFTAQEIEHCEGRAECLAGRFAVKEAVAKALGTGIGDVSWREIEIVCDGVGKPHLVLHGAARDASKALGFSEWAISLSHTATHAVGMAVALGSERPQVEE